MTIGLGNIVETTGTIDTPLSITLSIIGAVILAVSLVALLIPIYRQAVKNKPLKVSEGVQTAYYIVICMIILIGLGIFIIGGNITKDPVTIKTYDIINGSEVKIGTVTATYKDDKLIDIDYNYLGSDENKDAVRGMSNAIKELEKD